MVRGHDFTPRTPGFAARATDVVRRAGTGDRLSSGQDRGDAFIGDGPARGKIGRWTGYRFASGKEILPRMHADEIRTNALSERVIGCAFRVLNTPGSGFPAKVNENALALEMRKAGLSVALLRGVTICCDGAAIGDYVAGLVAEGTVIVALKASKTLDQVHAAQCINDPKATGLHLCLLLNFGKPRLESHRIAHEV